jgi:hypothetical protein
MSKEAKYIKSKLLEDYYTNIYNEFLFKKSILATGISYAEKSIERYWKKSKKNPCSGNRRSKWRAPTLSDRGGRISPNMKF